MKPSEVDYIVNKRPGQRLPRVSGTLKPEFQNAPPRILALPVDHRGYPVPFFVAWIEKDGVEVPDHRVVDPARFVCALKERLCWICGQKLGIWLAFAIGPMCAINRTISEPPGHRDCATWSIQNCPFLAQPQAARREEGLPEGCVAPAGVGLKRNPGVVCLWVTKSFEIFNDGKGKPLISIGKPEEVEWYFEGRRATRLEVEDALTNGLPAIHSVAQSEGKFALAELDRRYDAIQKLLPAPALACALCDGLGVLSVPNGPAEAEMSITDPNPPVVFEMRYEPCQCKGGADAVQE